MRVCQFRHFGRRGAAAERRREGYTAAYSTGGDGSMQTGDGTAHAAAHCTVRFTSVLLAIAPEVAVTVTV